MQEQKRRSVALARLSEEYGESIYPRGSIKSGVSNVSFLSSCSAKPVNIGSNGPSGKGHHLRADCMERVGNKHGDKRETDSPMVAVGTWGSLGARSSRRFTRSCRSI